MQQFANQARSKFSKTSGVFRPPPGGSAYFGQSYRWQQAMCYKHWAFVAIKTWMVCGAGGDPPNLGTIIREEKEDKIKHKVIRKAIRKSLGGPQQSERFEPFEWQDPMRKVFRNPNGPDVAFDLWCWHYLFKKLMGIAYWWIKRSQLGVPEEIWVVPSHWVRMNTGQHGMPSTYTIQSPWGYQEEVSFDEMVCFYEHSPLNRWEGYAVNQAVGEWIDTYEASTRARLAQYKNGAIPTYHIQLGDSYGDPDEQALSRYYSKLFQRFRGEGNTNKPIITGSDVDIKPLGINPVDMAYNTTEEQIRDMVLCAYGIPKVIIGLVDNMTYGSIAAAQEQFYGGALNPDLKYSGEVITEKIVAPTGENQGLEHYKDGVCFWDARTANDPEMKLRIIESRRQGGSIVPNEERTEYGDEPYEYGGDDPIVAGQEMPWSTGGKDKVQEAIAATGNSDSVDAQAGVSEQIMEMQRAVTAGEMSREMAVANAQHVFGFDKMQADQLFVAAQLQQANGDANINMAFRRSMAESSGGAGGFTVGGRLDLQKRIMDKVLKNGRH